MLRVLKNFAAAAVLAILALSVITPVHDVRADTPNIAIATPGVVLVPVHLQGQFTATVTSAATLKLPFPAKVVGVSATARASGGTTPTLTVDVLDDASSVLSAPISVTAGAISEGAVATAKIADESVLTIDLTIGGGTPTWDDVDVLLTLVRN